MEQPLAIRAVREDELAAILDIVNEAAEAYRGKIPADCWREPYMDETGLRREIGRGRSLSPAARSAARWRG